GYGVSAESRLSIVAAVDEADVEPLPGIELVKKKEDLGSRVPRIDFVDICTPTSSHLELVTWSLAQGYHVMCEKPVALSVGEAEQIRAAARKAGRVVMPCHQYRYNPAWL